MGETKACEGRGVIEVRVELVGNREHFGRLLAFCREVMAVCTELGITPVLSGSLAVLGYTRDSTMEIHDIDLACSEVDFMRLARALEAEGIRCELRPWHVLQVLRDGLKVEFDSMEYWLADLPDECETLRVDGIEFKVVGLAGLRKLYRRGLEATRDEGEREKHLAIAAKYEALCAV